MRVHSLLGILAVSLFLIGCSTHTQSPTAVNRLQIQVAQMERQLENRDKAIGDLQAQVHDMSSELNEIKTYSLYEPIEEYDYRKTARAPLIEEDEDEPAVRETEQDERIIRVKATEREVQQALKNAGFYNGKIDGKIGAQSRKAIQDFQLDHKLKADGIVGRRTWTELKTYLD
ncbi:MAG: peptidoglycan-binding protein [Candidatus Omnitrophica bacterium]|nr:peptidoglycan-binding protein [Candidatus Omnitrophota bacterium]